ncbi:MAG: potassium transporter Kup [Solirubrobacteraceae bacterium]
MSPESVEQAGRVSGVQTDTVTPSAKPHRSLYEAAHKLPYRRSLREGGAQEEYEREEARLDRHIGPGGNVVQEAIGEQDVIANASRAVMALGALGVVFGDIGTSPLYAEQVTFEFKAAQHVVPSGVYGVVSLIFWSLAVVVSTKYAGFIMRAHNRGDGGIMALAALCRRHKVAHAATLVTLGIFGASLFFGDGMITPAISVLSAVSGLEIATPGVAHLVVPLSVVILVVLFFLQRKGTGTVGTLFGPAMLIWFTTLLLIGLPEVIKHPEVLQALNPLWGVRFFVDHKFQAFLALGGVVLSLTGAEALYADRGHFGPGPIRMAWFFVVWPAVLVNYMGQAGWILEHLRAPLHAARFNPFFSVVPAWFRLPEVLIATVATVIASQAVISGSFTVARQAMQLGYLPRLRVIHTSEMEGQIYVPVVNWILAAGVISLVLIFQSSNGLANAYGVAVTGTFVLNTILFLSVSRALWKTPRWQLVVLGVLFLTFEVAFFLANMAKLFHGAWMPLAVGILTSMVMLTWRAGLVIVNRNRERVEGDLGEFIEHLSNMQPPVTRVPGVAVFLSPTAETTPLALRGIVEHTHALHERIVLVSVDTVSLPVVASERRFVARTLGRGRFRMTHIVIRNGYRETHSVPQLLALARKLGYLERALDLEHASYFLSRITISETDSPGMAMWRKRIFLTMARNAANPIEHFGLPVNRTVQMGSQISV